MLRILRLFSLFITVLSGSLRAYEESLEYANNDNCCDSNTYFPNLYPNKFYIGPEIYHVNRLRDGGTRQRGWVYGVRAGYDRVKRCKLYWGATALWAQGPLRGKSNSVKLKSTFSDQNIEGRIGYTWQKKCGYHFTFSPFVGYGYFRETNHFHRNHPLKVKFRNCYNYAAVGFLSRIEICPCWTVGINFKARFPFDSRCHVSNDPEFDNTRMLIQDRVHYRLEIPLAYRLCDCNEQIEFDLVPFYEYRHYGGRVNYPFDFLDTKLNIYGVSLQFSYRI